MIVLIIIINNYEWILCIFIKVIHLSSRFYNRKCIVWWDVWDRILYIVLYKSYLILETEKYILLVFKFIFILIRINVDLNKFVIKMTILGRYYLLQSFFGT